MSTENRMRAVALNEFGSVETMSLQTLPVPKVEANEVRIRVHFAGVGVWDPFEREGGYAEAVPGETKFPYVLGSEGSGVIVEVGSQVNTFKPGDRVYASAFLNPKGGFYAEYVAVDAGLVALLPDYLTMQQAAVMSGVGTTALRGLDDVLKLQPGETVLILGASGGIGHIAVQLAKQMGANVFAIASGQDGVAFVEKLGADHVVDGRQDDIISHVKAVSPEGLDAALLTAGGEAAEQALKGMKTDGRVAYPNGIQPEPPARPHLNMTAYNGELDREIIHRFHHMIKSGSYTIHVAQVFPLEDAQKAHQALETHYLGKLTLNILS